MRILLVNHEFTITGASTVFLRLATHLHAQGHDLTVYPCNPADGPIKPLYAELGIAVEDTCALTGFDLVIANTVCAAPVVLQTAPHVKTIWFLHETEIGLNILLQTPQHARAFELAAAVIYQTEYQRDVYRSFTYQLDQGKFHIIANGIAPAQPNLPNVPGKIRSLRIVQVGSVEPRKRPGDLIRAVAYAGMDAELVICGKYYELDEQARAMVDASPETYRLTGEIVPLEALAWMASADIYALVSGSESQPISVLEAATLARPLLLTDLPAYRGIFSHGRNCLLFPPGHVELLALTLRMYAASPRLREEMGTNAQRTARNYSGVAFFERFDALIRIVNGQ